MSETLRLLSPEEVADLIGYSPRQVRNWINGGRLRAIRPSAGGRWRIKESDLQVFLETWDTNERTTRVRRISDHRRQNAGSRPRAVGS